MHLMGSVVRNAAVNSWKSGESLSRARHIELRNVPVNTIPADLRRLVRNYNLQGVEDAAIIYEDFLPTRRALLTLIRPNFLQDNIKALKNASLSGIPITARELNIINTTSQLGSGPNGLTSGNGRNVILGNIPASMESKAIARLVADYALAGRPSDSIIRLPTKAEVKPSSYLIKCNSEPEAHRLVRDLHMTLFNQQRWPKVFIRARIVY